MVESWRVHDFELLDETLWPAVSMQEVGDSVTLVGSGYGDPPQEVLATFRASELPVAECQVLEIAGGGPPSNPWQC